MEACEIRAGGGDLTVRDLPFIDASSLMERSSVCFHVPLGFVLDYLAQVPPPSSVTSAAVKPAFCCRSAAILHGNSCCWAVEGGVGWGGGWGVLLHMTNTNEKPEPAG